MDGFYQTYNNAKNNINAFDYVNIKPLDEAWNQVNFMDLLLFKENIFNNYQIDFFKAFYDYENSKISLFVRNIQG